MPRFEPFPGLRYDLSKVRLRDVAAPPYDVLDDRQRAEVAARHERNAVLVDLPVPDGDRDQYEVARTLLAEWTAEGTLTLDDEPTFTIYRMTFTDEAGRERQTTGVIGALEIWPPEAGEVLPHEQTTKKAKSDRLDMLRICRMNTSAIWGLSVAGGLTDLLPTDTTPDETWTDPDGVTHTYWVSRDPIVNGRIAAHVRHVPVVIADGHHRYATSLAYRDERRIVDGPGTPADLTLMYVVELVEDELTVLPIHRLVSGLPDGTDLVTAFGDRFDVAPTAVFGPDAVGHLVTAGALGLITGDGCFTMTPKAGAFSDDVDLDTVRLVEALSDLPAHELVYQHGVGHVTEAVAQGRAQAAVLMRPATIGQIKAIATGGARMPPKTTFFAPKPATGTVFRSLG